MKDLADNSVLALLGIKVSYALAGFFGGVVSLYFLQGLTRTRAWISVLAGLLTATYGTPVACIYFNINQTEYQTGLAFVLGLTAMSVLPAVTSIVDSWTGMAKKRAIQPKQGEGDAP
jgi:hypothetical protein